MPALTDFIMIIYACFMYLAFGASDILKNKTILIWEVQLGRQRGAYLSQISAGGMFI